MMICMTKYDKQLYDKIILFRPFIKINKVNDSFNQLRSIDTSLVKKTFKSFNQEFRKNNTNASEYASQSLAALVMNDILTLEQIDEVLFTLIEESLFNSYIYRLVEEGSETNGKRLDDWQLPKTNKILDNIGIQSNKDFIICGYRLVESSPGMVETLRLLAIDNQKLQIYEKKVDVAYEIIYPTLIEYDFRRKLLHIRTQEIENITNNDSKLSTKKGRNENTLEFISSFKNPIQYEPISNFKEKLFNLEESILESIRIKIDHELDNFKEPLNTFCKAIDNKYTVRADDIPTVNYVKTSIQTIIAMNTERNPLGQIVGIRFRNSTSEESQYSEITILDKQNKCISMDNLYWLNLAVLLDVKSIEFLKLVLYIDQLSSVVNLDFSLDTGNIKLIKNKVGEDGTMPTQQKYDLVLNELMPYI